MSKKKLIVRQTGHSPEKLREMTNIAPQIVHVMDPTSIDKMLNDHGGFNRKARRAFKKEIKKK